MSKKDKSGCDAKNKCACGGNCGCGKSADTDCGCGGMTGVDGLPEVVVLGDEDDLSREKKRTAEAASALRYLQADFDNYRKRMTTAVSAAREDGRREVVEKLLPALDALLGAREMLKANPIIVQGINHIAAKLFDTLSELGVSTIDALGKELDPNFHHAVSMRDEGMSNSGKVVEVFQQGYVMNGVVIRAAQVIVGK